MTLEALLQERTGRADCARSEREHHREPLNTAGRVRTERRNRDTLVRLGWLRRNPDDRNGRTGRYTLCRPAHIQHTTPENVGDASVRTWLAHDAFRPDALGDDSWYLLASLRGHAEFDRLAWVTGLGVEALKDTTASRRSGSSR